MQPTGSGLDFTIRISQEGGNYKMIGYDFSELILRHHVNGNSKDEIIRVENTKLDLDVMIDSKPSDKGNTFAVILKPHDLTIGQAGKIEGLLNKKW